MNKHEKYTKLWAIANANMYISCRQNRIDQFHESVLLWSSTLCNIVQNGINIISFIILLLGTLIFALLGSICRYTYTHVAVFFLNKEKEVHCMYIDSLTRYCPWLSFPPGIRSLQLFLLHYLHYQHSPYVFHSYGSFKKYNRANKRVKLADISKS